MDRPSEVKNSKSRYKGLVKSKVAKKRNNLHRGNIDAHYYPSRVRYRLELGTEFEDETVMLSADCMNKIHIGGLAVSKYHQLRNLFLTEDSPNYPDHDFLTSNGNKITPSGYMVLSRKEGADADKLGHTVFKFPKTGSSYIFNRLSGVQRLISRVISMIWTQF